MSEMAEGPSAAACGRRASRPRVRFSAKVGRAICDRVAGGETVQAICGEADMPNRGTVTAWAKAHAPFAARLARARALGGWEPGQGRRSGYCEVTAREIFARLCEGELMKAICGDPAMPSQSTVTCWRERVPAFAERMVMAREIQAERFCDLGWEIAQAVTPGDAYATHVKLMQLRWTAGAMNPGRYGRFKPVEAAVVAEAPPEEQTILFRHFRVEERLEDGAVRVVAFTPDPETRQLVREDDDPPWSLLPPARAARWRSKADDARAAGVVGYHAPGPDED